MNFDFVPDPVKQNHWHNMDRITLTFFVVFIVSGLREGVAARKPTISSNAKDGMIQEGNELKIFCEGDGKLHFSVMDVPSDKDSCNHTINYGPNNASFVCHNATRSDTRWYACAEEGIVIRNTDQTIEHLDEHIAWIHIYVNSTEPFAQMSIGRELPVTETGPVVFPCRTTSPHWEVLLHTTNENLTGHFDPRIGFIATEGVNHLLTQEINCSVINEPRALRDMKSVSYRLADEEDDFPMPKPEIDKIALHHMVWGRDQNINCTITVPSSQNLTLQWKAPESVHHQRLITTRFTTDTADPMYTSYISKLTIKNVTENDGGSYTCFIQEFSDDDEAADTCDIKFWDPNHFFVDVRMVEGHDYRSIVGEEGKTSRWNIKIDAYPEYSLHWYKIDHQELKEINFNNSSKYSVSDTFRTDGRLNHLFEVHNSDVYDNGDYLVRVRTKYNTSDLHLNLTIDVQPILKITPYVEYVAPGQSMNFFCTTVSHPLANVTWRYMERPNYPSLDGNRSVTLLDYKELSNIDAVTLKSQLNIKINDTGHLICRSCNYINCVEVSKLIYVSGVAARKPTIRSNAKDGMIQEGNELRIFCEGDGKLHFSVMDVPSDEDSCNHTINYGPNNASFVCHNATRSDTRWYACAEEGIVIRNTDQTIEHLDEHIAWIHIYVNSTEPFAQMATGRELPVTKRGPAVFPCRTTSPHWIVMAHTRNENLTGHFDPRIGFIATEGVNHLLTQEINCSVINEPRALRDMKSVSYRLADEEDDFPMPKPEIDKIALHHMVWGRDQNINCTITVPSSQNLTLQWKAPESVHHQRLITTRFTTDTADPMYTSHISKLTIKNVTENDGGSYTCFIQEFLDDDGAADTCDIKFWDPNHFFVDVRMVEGDDYRSIVGEEGKTSRWNIKIDAYPEYSLHWYKNNGEKTTEIDFKNSSKYSVSDTFRIDGRLNHLFEIHKSDVHDNGEYVIRVRTKHDTSEINLHLTIDAPPVPKIIPSLTYVAPGQSTNFLCMTVSHPLANVTWSYMELPNYPSLNGNRSASLLDFGEFANHDAVTSVSHLNIKINDTGHLTCRSCNYISCVEDTKLISVSDVNASFAIMPLESVAEGDSINITCGISSYLNFSSDEILKWNVNRSDLETGRMRVLKKKTKFTHLSILQISRVTRSDDGIYICDVLDKSKGFKPQAYNLSVAAGSKPKIYEWNMNTSQLVIDTGKKRKDDVILICLADGMPKPEITWLKDNKSLPKHNGYKISQDKSELQMRYLLEQDSGRYTCRVVNRFGSDERSVDIVVNEGRSHIIHLGLICGLVIIIVIIIACIGLKANRKRLWSKKLLKAGSVYFVKKMVERRDPKLNIDDQAKLLSDDKK
ncbi:vascular endothelial growth factor receptor 1-like isoform X2 [Neodiprion pinetum]|uniref:vascular endothelial growth factor receptor 1-like isoform X2 n=1 Tax=Neodiprion pinetum TaxID=441929 RepID=UPI001EE046D1|nr:titin-like isoform X2 [Neodiprion pinetum]